MSVGSFIRRHMSHSLIVRFVVPFSVLGLMTFPLGCGQEKPDEPAAAAGSSASGAGLGGAGGSSAGAGAAAPGGSAGTAPVGGGAGAQAGGAGGAVQTGGAGGVPGGGAGAGGQSDGGTSAVGGSGGAGDGGAGLGGAGGTMAGAGMGGDSSGAGGMAAGGASGASGAGGAGGAAVNPLADLVPSAETIGLLLAQRFSKQALSFSTVANLPGDGYKTACEWYGSLGVAKLTANQTLLNTLVTKFDPLKASFVSAMLGGDAHVDRYIFGMVPLEIYLQTGDASYLPLGTQVADNQQVTNQTRDAIDDMFMMTGLQVQAYRATKDTKYLDFMSKTMVQYLKAQQPNGLFFHNVTQAPVHWGRGNGWFASGMAEMMRDLPTSSADYATIEAGYKKMMAGLLTYQGPNGLWYQVLDMPNDPSNWEESSGSAMFTYAMIAGVRRGILDAPTYVPAIQAAWAGLQTKISPQGDVSSICTGTWYKATAQEYMALTRLTGDGHGQAPVLWAAAELLR